MESTLSDDPAAVSKAPEGTNKCSSRHSTCDCYSRADEEAKLDAVLASVHKLIECLDSEMDNCNAQDLNDDPMTRATEQLTSFHYVTNAMEDWFLDSRETSDKPHFPTGASKQCLKGGDEKPDKKPSAGSGETIRNKFINEALCVSSKENKNFFTSADLPLISASKSNEKSVAEARLKRQANVSIRSTSNQDKQMTKEKIQLKFSQKLIKTLPALEEIASDLSEYSEPKAPSQKSGENLEKNQEKKANTVNNNFELSTCSITTDNKLDSCEHSSRENSLNEKASGNINSFSALTSSTDTLELLDIETIREDLDIESDSSETDRDIDSFLRIKNYLSEKLARQKSCSNEQEITSDISSLNSFKEDVFDHQSLKHSPTFIKKIVNMSGSMAKKSAFLARHKNFFRSFRRSQTYSGKQMSSKKHRKDSKNLPSFPANDNDSSVGMEDLLPCEEGKRYKKGLIRCTRSEPSGINHQMPQDQRDDFYEDSMHLNDVDECFDAKELSTLYENDFDLDVDETFDYREGASVSLSSNSSDYVSSDSSRRWKSTSDANSHLLSPHHPSMVQRASTGHLERLTDQKLLNRKDYPLSLRGSQDSLDSVRKSSTIKFRSFSQLGRLDKLADSTGDQQLLDPLSRFATIITKNRFRNPLKNVGKSSSVTLQEPDEMAERTWNAESDGSWSNGSGKKVELQSTNLQSLSELECEALRTLALGRLQEAEIGVTIIVPKDESIEMKRKVSARKKKGLLTKDKNKEKSIDHVFGIPLIDVVENDQLLRLQKSFYSSMDCPHVDSPSLEDHPAIPGSRVDYSSASSSGESSCSGSLSSLHNHPEEKNHFDQEEHAKKTDSNSTMSPDPYFASSPLRNLDSDSNSDKESSSPTQLSTPPLCRPKQSSTSQSLRRRGAIAADSQNEIDEDQSQLLEALSLSVQSETNQSQKKVKNRSMLAPTMPQVPYVVQKCCDHIKKYGLDAEGIFRIAGSKKRIRQLREEFDRGVDVTIDEDYHPHDVAALLKEFFRDLPEALLTRELFPAFLQTTKMPQQQKQDCLRYILWLLPISNRDTLHTLLNFLAVVASHSETACDQHGNRVPGNKMTIYNLAAIFGPNILHRYKNSQAATENHYQGPCLEKPEDTTAVIKVVEELITNQVQLFQIPKEDHDDILRTLKEWNPTAVDYLLRRKAATQTKETSRLHSISSVCSSHSKSSGSRHSAAADENLEAKRKSESWEEDSNSSDRIRSASDARFAKSTGSESFVRSSTLRMSYQQATGHAPLLDSDDSNSAIQVKRQQREDGQRLVPNCVNEQIRSDQTNSKTEVNDVSSKTSIQSRSFSTSEDQLLSPDISKIPSTFFTEDDLQSILGHTAVRYESGRSNPSFTEKALTVPASCKNYRQITSFLPELKSEKNKRSVGLGPQNGNIGSTQAACLLGPNAFCDKVAKNEVKSSSKEEDCNNNQCQYRTTCSSEDYSKALSSQNNSLNVNHNNNNSNNNNSENFFEQPMHLYPRTVATINSVLNPNRSGLEKAKMRKFKNSEQRNASQKKRPVPLPRTRLPTSDKLKTHFQSDNGAVKRSPKDPFSKSLHGASNSLLHLRSDVVIGHGSFTRDAAERSRNHFSEKRNDIITHGNHFESNHDIRNSDIESRDIAKSSPQANALAPKTALRTKFFPQSNYANECRGQKFNPAVYIQKPMEGPLQPHCEKHWSSASCHVNASGSKSNSLNNTKLVSSQMVNSSHSWYNTASTSTLSETLV